MRGATCRVKGLEGEYPWIETASECVWLRAGGHLRYTDGVFKGLLVQTMGSAPT